MELLGNESTSKDAVTTIALLNRHLLTMEEISESDTQDLLTVLSLLADSDNDELLHNGEVSSLILLLMENRHAQSIPMIKNLVTEVKLRTIRTQCLNIDNSDMDTDTSALRTKVDTSKEKEEDFGQYFEATKEEKFVPGPNDTFTLPPKGETTNLTVTEPNFEIGKNLIRELIIDSEGRVLEEQSRRYEDIYTDESEEIYNNAHLTELRKLYKSKDSNVSNNVCLPAEDNLREQNYAGGARRELNV